MISLPILHQRIAELWKLDNSFEMLDIEGGIFVIRFRSKEDYEKGFGRWPMDSVGSLFVNKQMEAKL